MDQPLHPSFLLAPLHISHGAAVEEVVDDAAAHKGAGALCSAHTGGEDRVPLGRLAFAQC